jgi:hypothetical protein
VLVPGQEALRYRACQERQKFNLLGWFAVNERVAWVAVNAIVPNSRPESIFLVTGQTLTTEYSITHQSEERSGCDIFLSANAEVPSIIQANAHLGYGYQKVTASSGFEVRTNASEDARYKHYSVYLQVHKSFPQKQWSVFPKSLKVRLEDMFMYFVYSCNLIPILIYRIFKKASGQAVRSSTIPHVKYSQNESDQQVSFCVSQAHNRV